MEILDRKLNPSNTYFCIHLNFMCCFDTKNELVLVFILFFCNPIYIYICIWHT